MICAYKHCRVEFEPKRPHQRYHQEPCRYAQWVLDQEDSSEAPAQRVGLQDLDEVRALHEESKGHWTTIVREHLNRTLLVTGYVSAEDFDELGIPPEHSNLANAQMGGYSRMGYMEAISWRRSTKPSRKSGKIWTHKLTEKGRLELSHTLVGISDNDKGGGPAADNAPRSPGNAGTSPSGAPVVVVDPGEEISPVAMGAPIAVPSAIPSMFDPDAEWTGKAA